MGTSLFLLSRLGPIRPPTTLLLNIIKLICPGGWGVPLVPPHCPALDATPPLPHFNSAAVKFVKLVESIPLLPPEVGVSWALRLNIRGGGGVGVWKRRQENVVVSGVAVPFHCVRGYIIGQHSHCRHRSDRQGWYGVERPAS